MLHGPSKGPQSRGALFAPRQPQRFLPPARARAAVDRRAMAGAAAAAAAIISVVALSASAPQYDPDRAKAPQSSGPFELDSSEYALGENIFLVVSETDPSVSGSIEFLRPSGGGHVPYKTIPFEGRNTPFNQYFTPVPFKPAGICSGEDLAGGWIVTFEGTPYPPLRFEIDGGVKVPGQEHRFEDVC